MRESESHSPELAGSVGNVSEITVAGLMGVNTVADGERPRPVQQRGTAEGEILASYGQAKLLYVSVSPLHIQRQQSY